MEKKKLITDIKDYKRSIEKNRFTTISIDRDNYKILKRLGYMGESFNTVLDRLLEPYKKTGDSDSL